MSWDVKLFDSNDVLVAALTAQIVLILRQAIERDGQATMAVSGGGTPKPLFARLATVDLPWQKVTVTLVDERWVDDDHSDSNAKLVKHNLLQDKAAAATFIPLKTSASDPFAAEDEVAQRLRAIRLPFDLVILGMGSDGHTASFFPGADNLAQVLESNGLDPNKKALCRGVHPPTAPHDRMTLTLSTVLNTEHLFLHVVGEEKWRVLQNAMQVGREDELPIRAALHQEKVLLDIYYAAE